jgi:hypothetical protein
MLLQAQTSPFESSELLIKSEYARKISSYLALQRATQGDAPSLSFKNQVNGSSPPLNFQFCGSQNIDGRPKLRGLRLTGWLRRQETQVRSHLGCVVDNVDGLCCRIARRWALWESFLMAIAPVVKLMFKARRDNNCVDFATKRKYFYVDNLFITVYLIASVDALLLVLLLPCTPPFFSELTASASSNLR